MKNVLGFIFIMTVLLAACSGANPGGSTGESTAAVSTILPVVITPLSPLATPEPATPIPTLSSGPSPTELKYRVLGEFPDLFFCDPDYYPVARADETDLARERFPDLQANDEEFQAILSHTGMSGRASFKDQQKLQIYREHKRLAAVLFEISGDQYRFQLQVSKSDGQGTLITGFIDREGVIMVLERQPGIATCPICLAAGTWIDTPDGPVTVEDLQPGDMIWTLDQSGRRIQAALLKTVRVFVPASHRVVHILLDDGRQLWASPGHPTAGGRKVGDLRTGDLLDGGRVIRLDRVRYDQPATYDILPSGGTGLYWANGILLGSTLAGSP